MEQDELKTRPYNPDEEIDYDKEMVFVTPHGAKVVVPLEGIIKWQKRHYQREIGEQKSYIAELEDANKLLTQQKSDYENTIAQLKETIRGLRADIRENPYYQEKIKHLHDKNLRLSQEFHLIRKTNRELVSKLISHGIPAEVYVSRDEIEKCEPGCSEGDIEEKRD